MSLCVFFFLTVMIMPGKKDTARPCLSRAFFNRAAASLPSLKSQLIFWPLLTIGLTLDLASKAAVFAWLQQKPHNTFVVINGFFQLVALENTGAAFGIAAGQKMLLIGFSVVALMVIFVVFLFYANQQRLVHVALGLFAAGVCGNLYDRLFNDGLVRDFIDIVYWPGRHWPAFNLADSMLCIAVGLIIISGLYPSGKEKGSGTFF